MDHQSRYAEKLLAHQAEHVKSLPLEKRKTITRLAWIIGLILIVLLIFMGYCLYLGKEDFVLKLIQILGYFITTWVGYYFGKKNTGGKNNSSVRQEAYQDVSA